VGQPRFRKLDHRARILQNQFWRQHLALIIGGLLATSLGAIQAAVGGGVEALAVAQVLLTGGLAGLTVLIRSRRAQHGYLTARLRAERIKSEFFLFLARVGGYGERGDPAARLIEQVGDIETAEGAT
jgi:conflict system pore-forming effector with SLATT domain